MKNWQNKMERRGNEIYFPARWLYKDGPTNLRWTGFTRSPLSFFTISSSLLPEIAEDLAPVVGESAEDVLEFLTELCEPGEEEDSAVDLMDAGGDGIDIFDRLLDNYESCKNEKNERDITF